MRHQSDLSRSLLSALALGLTLGACGDERPPADEFESDSWRALEADYGEVEPVPEPLPLPLPLPDLISESKSVFGQRTGAALRSPFPGNTESRLYNCPADPSSETCTNDAQCKASNRLNECYIAPGETEGKCGHHRPWNGDWAIDLFAADGDSCGEDSYLRLSPSTLPGGLPPDGLRVQPNAPTPACSSGELSKGGYDQTFTVYARYDDQDHVLGEVLIAHLDNPVYNGSPVSNLDPSNLYVGKVWEPDGALCEHNDEASCLADTGCAWSASTTKTKGEAGSCYNPCWNGCHLHFELDNAAAATASCWQNMCGDSGLFDPPAWGVDSIIGMLGGSDKGDLCERFDDDTSMACATWDHDLAGCDAHGHGTTQDCAYYTTTDKCRPRGTPNCQAGIGGDCGVPESEPCSVFDSDLNACDLHGLLDPDKNDDTQDCAYYLQSNRCMPRGTSNCVADCDNCVGSGCDNCDQADCPSTDPQI